jgi:putative membrane protein insertion efficiency factor
MLTLAGLMAMPQAAVSFGHNSARPDSIFRAIPTESAEELPTPSPLAWPAVALISLYQKTFSVQQGQVCAFQPTCSHFSQEAFRKYGLLQGALMTSDRLQRCHYCATGHYPLAETGFSLDPVENHLLWGEIPFHPLPLSQLPAPSPQKGPKAGDPRLAFADHLCATGDYSRAFAQYLAFWRSAPQGPGAGWARLRGGICLQKMSRWTEATSLFQDLAAQEVTSSLRNEAFFQMALTQCQAGRNREAPETLRALDGTSRSQRASLLAGWIHLGHGEWSAARSSGREASSSTRREISQAGQLLMEKATRGPQLAHRSPMLAALFSAAVPGAGKWYAGKPADGLYSLFVVGSTAAVAHAYEDDNHRTQALAFGALGLFFYLGNIFGSAAEAKGFNRKTRESFLHDLSESAHAERWIWHLEDMSGSRQEVLISEKSFDLAEDHFREGQYDQAITEYKRHLYFFPEDPRRGLAHYKMGMAYLNQDRWQAARHQLRAVSRMKTTEELQYRSRLRAAQSFLDQDHPEISQWDLRNLLSDPLIEKDEVRRTVVQYWLGVSSLQQGRWVEAEGLFQGLWGRSPGSILHHPARQLSQAAREGFHLPQRSPTLAAGLSSVLPGSGQIYCGHLWNGLLSLAFNVSAGYLTVNAFRDGRRLDGTLLASLLWWRFYFGGRQNAARYAREYNQRVREEHLERYKELMMPDYRE